MSRRLLTSEQVRDGLCGLAPGWTGSTEQISRTWVFQSFLAAVDFIDRLAPIAEELDHHPDVWLSWRTIRLTLTTHSSGGVSQLDLELAGRLDSLTPE